MTTPILQLDEWQQGQSQPHVPVNTAIRWLELFSRLSVLSATETTPPSGSAVSDGDAYIVPTGATGDWADQDGKIAMFLGTAWAFKEAPLGSFAWVVDTETQYRQIASLTWTATLKARTISATTGSLQLSDMDSVVETTNSSAVTLTVPANASVAFPVGSTVIVRQIGAGQVNLSAEGGVTLQVPSALNAVSREQYSVIALSKRATNTWIVSGDLEVGATS